MVETLGDRNCSYTYVVFKIVQYAELETVVSGILQKVCNWYLSQILILNIFSIVNNVLFYRDV